MAGNCDIKITAEANNYGINEFRKAFLQTGDMDSSLSYAISQINQKYDNTPFNIESFTDPIVSALKKSGTIEKSYRFGDKKTKGVEGVVSRALEKMKGLSSEQKKTLARKLTEKFYQDGALTNDSVKSLYAEALGMPSLTPEVEKQIEQVAKDRKAVEDVERRITESVEYVAKNELTEEQKQEYRKRFDDLMQEREEAENESMKSKVALGKSLEEKRYWLWNVGPMITLNFMAPKTLAKNLTGMAVDGVFRNLSSIISTPISSALLKRNLFFSRWKGANFKKAFKRLGRTFKYGTVPSKGAEIDSYDYLNAVNSFEKLISSVKDKDIKDSAINTLGFVMRIHPDFIKRALSAPDYAVYTLVESGELYRIGKEKGLSGVEMDAFLAKPDEASAKRAEDRAKEVTLKGDMPKLLESISSITPESVYEKMVASGSHPFYAKNIAGLAGIAKALTAPFIKAPYNLFKIATKFVVPEYRMAKGVNDYLKYKKEGNPERAKIAIAEATGDATVGFILRYVAINMVANALISAGYDDEDEKTKEAVYKVAGGPNKINTTAMWRGMMGGEFKPKEGDSWVDLSSVGVMGIVMGAYAHAYHSKSPEQIEQETSYARDMNNLWRNPTNAIISEFQTGLDMPFLTGYNQILNAMKDKEGKKIDKYLANSFKSMMGAVFPSTHQQISRSVSGDVYASYDKEKSLSENIFDSFGYNFFFSGGEGMKKKLSSLSSSEKEAYKKKEHHLFDNQLGRILFSMDPFSTTESTPDLPITRLYKEAMAVEAKERENFFPATPSEKVNIGKRNKPVYVNLKPEQYEYYQKQASLMRMLYASPFIMSTDFKEASTETKTKVLQGLYSKALSKAKIMLKDKYPDLKNTQLDSGENSKDTKKLLKKYSKESKS